MSTEATTDFDPVGNANFAKTTAKQARFTGATCFEIHNLEDSFVQSFDHTCAKFVGELKTTLTLGQGCLQVMAKLLLMFFVSEIIVPS